MSTTQIHRRARVGFGSVLLCVLFLPGLHLITHPVSVLHGTDYRPFLLQLDDFYESKRLILVSLIASPLLVVALILLMQRERIAFLRALSFLVAPFLLSLSIQYLIAVQLDKYLRFPRAGQRIPWEQVFQPAFMLDCLLLAAGYAVVCAALYLIASLIWKKLTAQ